MVQIFTGNRRIYDPNEIPIYIHPHHNIFIKSIPVYFSGDKKELSPLPPLSGIYKRNPRYKMGDIIHHIVCPEIKERKQKYKNIFTLSEQNSLDAPSNAKHSFHIHY